MSRHPDEATGKQPKLPVIEALDTLLSLTFLVLAASIGWYASGMSGNNGRDLLWYSALLGAYGIWRAIRSVIRQRRSKEDKQE